VTERLAEYGLAGLTLAGWAVVAYVVLALPVSPAGEVVFYTAGFVALAGLAAFAYGFWLARVGRRADRPPALATLGTGMRFAFAAEFGLWLQSLRVLTGWHVLLLVVGFLFMEFLFSSLLDERDARRR
jgi:hypothetical protein